MIVIGSCVLGAFLGARNALKRGGRKLDALQYGAAYAIAFTLAGVFITIILERTLQ